MGRRRRTARARRRGSPRRRRGPARRGDRAPARRRADGARRFGAARDHAPPAGPTSPEAQLLAQPARWRHGLARFLREGLEVLALLPRQLRRDDHVRDHVEVAPGGLAPEVGYPAAAKPDLGAGLGPGLDLDVGVLPVDRRHLDARPERRLRDRQLRLVEQLGALALEGRVVRDVHRDVQAPRGAASRPDLALAREADLVPFVDSRRDGHPKAPPPLGAALAVARVAGVLDDPALAATAGTGRCADHLPEHRLADRTDLAASLALRALDGVGPGLGTRPAAGLAASEDGELDLLLGPQHRLLEGDPEVVAQVAPGLGTGAAPGVGRAAEEGVEDVAEAAESGGVEPRATALLPAAHAGAPEHVVLLAALRIGEDLVGLVDLLEPCLRLGLLVHVRVPLLREAAEGALDLGVAGAALDAEHLVEVTFRSHGQRRVYGTRGEDPVRVGLIGGRMRRARWP